MNLSDQQKKWLITQLKKFPYAYLRGVAPREANGRVVTVLEIKRGMVTFKVTCGGDRIRRLPLACFDPLVKD